MASILLIAVIKSCVMSRRNTHL